MAGRHKKILAQLQRINDEKEKSMLAKMDSNQRWDYYAKKNMAGVSSREIEPIVIDGITFDHNDGSHSYDIKYPLGRKYPAETSIADEFGDKVKYGIEYDAGMHIFFRGGTLEDFGLRRKPGIAARTHMQTLRFLLTDFTPSAERKWKTLAWYLHNTCDRIEATEPVTEIA